MRADERLELVGALRGDEARPLWRTLNRQARDAGQRLDLDLSRTTVIDPLVVVLLVELRRSLGARGTTCDLVHVPARIESLVRLYDGAPSPPRRVGRHIDPLSHLGAFIASLARRAVDPLRFVGELVVTLGYTVRRPRIANWRAIPVIVQHAGAEAIPVVIVLLFLIGCTIALQATPQLRLLGANVYVADLVGISVTRELAPLMTAIVMIGRSGAGFAAEIGTMRISEEVDALRTIGIAPMPYLVLPRVLGLAIVAPMLVLIGDVSAVLGGLVVGVLSLDLAPQAYRAELQASLIASDVWTGLVKATAFGIAIALVGCQEGLATSGSAAGVGRRTTATVVTSLFAIVIIDTFLTIMFRRVNV